MSKVAKIFPTKIYLTGSGVTVTNESNMYTDVDSTTYATINNDSSGRITVGGFDFSSIPADRVLSYAIKIKSRTVSTGSTSNQYLIYNGDSVGQNSLFSYKLSRITTSTNIAENLIPWSDLISYGENLNINIPLENRGTTYVYGIEIEVVYDPLKNKVIYDGNVLIDLTSDTVTPDKLASGYTAHDSSGAIITGSAKLGGAYQDGDGYVVLKEDESSAPQGTLAITTNGTYDVSEYAGATVNIATDRWSWIGKNAAIISSKKLKLTFRELGVDEWTWSTSSTTLRDATSDSSSSVVTLTNYDLVIQTLVNVVYDYGDWATPINAPKSYAYADHRGRHARNQSFAQGDYDMVDSTSFSFNSYALRYFDSNGSLYGTRSSTGVSATATAPTTSITGATITLTARYPKISIVGSNSYFTETAFANLDFDNSYVDIAIKFIRVDGGTGPFRYPNVDNLIDILQNGL